MYSQDTQIEVETTRELDLGIEVISEVAMRMPFCAATRMPFCSMSSVPLASIKSNASAAAVLLSA